MSMDFSGMTLNERLYKAGLMEEYDDAVKKQNRNQLVDILKQVNLEDKEASYVIDMVLKNPRKYGH